MIDFRYHLVSLVSVFLALAVGIALGAGPLKDPIANGLLQSVQSARQESDALRDQLKTAQAGSANRDTFISQLEPELVRDQLGGRSVVLVTLPGADTDAVRPLTKTLTDAGAKVTGRIDVQDAWVDPANRAARDKAVAALQGASGGLVGATPSGSAPAPSASRPAASATGSAPGSSPSPSATAGPGAANPNDTAGDLAAAGLLARAVLTTDLATSEKTDDVERTLLDGLAKAGLVDVNGDLPGRATQVVVLAPVVAQAVQGATPTPTASPGVDPTRAWVSLAQVLDDASTGAVVVGPASAATAGGVVNGIRAQSQLAGSLSTVDTGSTPMGDVTTVFALREQQLGGAGNYGFGDGAKAPLPARAAGGS
jgi:hypothetical protein